MFKQISFYRLPNDFDIDFDKIESALAKHPFAPCSTHDLFSEGFVPSAEHQPDLMLFRAAGCAMATRKIEEKILPAKVIREQLQQRIKQIESDEVRKVGRKESREIQERIVDELVTKAFSQTDYARAYIDPVHRFVVVNSATSAKAEGMLSSIREALGSLPTRLVDTQNSPSTSMTLWLSEGSAPNGFTLDSTCELKFPGENGAVIKAKNQSLDAEEIKNHLSAGKVCVQLGMTWNDRISFVLTEKLQIKNIAFLDILNEELENQDLNDVASLMEAQFTMMAGEFANLLNQLLEALGGERGEAA